MEQEITIESLKLQILQAKRWVLSHRWLVAIVGVTTLFVLLLSFSWGSSSSNPFLPYYVAYQPQFPDRNLSPWEEDILKHYQEKEYDNASFLLEQLCERPKVDIEFRLMLGSAYLELGESPKAIVQFEHVAHTRAIRIRRQGLWYLAIAQVKSGDHKAAHKTLETLLKDPDIYKDSAATLQSLLDV